MVKVSIGIKPDSFKQIEKKLEKIEKVSIEIRFGEQLRIEMAEHLRGTARVEWRGIVPVFDAEEPQPTNDASLASS